MLVFKHNGLDFCFVFKTVNNRKHTRHPLKPTGVTLTGRCLVDILLEVILELLLRVEPLRLAMLSVGAGFGASPTAVLPLLDL